MTARGLQRLITEIATSEHEAWALLSDSEAQTLREAFSGDMHAENRFMNSTAYTKLFDYFAFETGAMPYGTAKAHDADPVEWIIDRMQRGEMR